MLAVNGFIVVHGSEAERRAERGLSRLAHRARGRPPRLTQLSSSVALGAYAADAADPSAPILHGEFYEESRVAQRIEQSLEANDIEALGPLLAAVEGSFALAAVTDQGMLAARDPMGLKPLYHGENSDIWGIASEPQALVAAGFPTPAPVRPGTILQSGPGGHQFTRFYDVHERMCVPTVPEVAAELERLLADAVARRVGHLKHVATGFSGGLDSAVLTALVGRRTRVTPVTVALAGSRDAAQSRALAEKLGIPAHVLVIEPELAQRVASEFRSRWPDTSVMDLSIAVAIHLIGRGAAEAGAERLMLGQLADELFGGYAKYLRTLREQGAAPTIAMMRRDVLEAWSSNFERDERAAAPYLDLLLPYAALPVVEFGLNIPLHLKLDSTSGRRKIVLREVARRLGLPAEISEGAKRALQYSSGIQRLVEQVS